MDDLALDPRDQFIDLIYQHIMQPLLIRPRTNIKKNINHS